MLKKIHKVTASEFVAERHYSAVMPSLTKIFLGYFMSGEMVGVITFGWGTRPKHTIQKLFPELDTKDYYEIGKMCMDDVMPRNSESQMLSMAVKWLRENTDIKYLFTWADGIVGKPGYVYQAANFLYGGYITTDLYISKGGEKVHPRTAQGIMNEKDGFDVGRRPDRAFLIKHEWSHYRGKQFRYLYFMCNRRNKNVSTNPSKIII